MLEKGKLMTCDRCGKSIFIPRRRLMDADYDEKSDYCLVHMYSTGATKYDYLKDLCVECSKEFNDLTNKFFNKFEK